VKLKAKDSDPTQTLTYSATGLPAGLSINPVTGVISGTPGRITVVTATVTATDTTGSAGSAFIRWAVGWAITIPDPGTVTTTAGYAVNVALSYTNKAGSRDRVTLWATGMPHGAAFQQNPPKVFGWPVSAGIYNVTIHAKGSEGDIDWMTFPLIVRAAPDSGPTGQINLALDGKCLEDPANRTGNGTRLVIGTCLPGAAQRWTVASDGTIRVHGRCLDIAGGDSAAGQQVQLWQCTGGPREVWVQGTAGELVNPASGLCLTDPGSSTRNGTVPTMGTCRIKLYEAWTLPAQPVLAALGGKCIDDLHSGGTNGNVIDMYTCNGTPVQAWTFEPDGTLRVYGNKCITVRGALGRLGTRIQLWTCTAANRKGQQWSVVQTGDLSAELTLGGVCLAIPSMTAADGSQLVTVRCSATDPRVHWHIW
jgi:Ricin-type beta-trefoil lectin domain/Putative Ig domain